MPPFESFAIPRNAWPPTIAILIGDVHFIFIFIFMNTCRIEAEKGLAHAALGWQQWYHKGGVGWKLEIVNERDISWVRAIDHSSLVFTMSCNNWTFHTMGLIILNFQLTCDFHFYFYFQLLMASLDSLTLMIKLRQILTYLTLKTLFLILKILLF